MDAVRSSEETSWSRVKYNTVKKVKAVTAELIRDHHERLLALSDIGINQVAIAGMLEEDEHFRVDYGTFDILRSAVSAALRKLLSPEEAEERRLQAWRESMEAIPEHVRELGRLKGLAKTHELYDWRPEEEQLLLQLAPQCLHPESSRYAGKVDWARLTEAMHTYGEFHARKPNAYKQRYSILQKRLAEAPPMPPLPLADDTARLQQDAAVKYRSHY